jgi:hypothetical protein
LPHFFIEIRLGISTLATAGMMIAAPIRAIGHVRLVETLVRMIASIYHRTTTVEDGVANKQSADVNIALNSVLFLALLASKLNDDQERDIPWYRNAPEDIGTVIYNKAT